MNANTRNLILHEWQEQVDRGHDNPELFVEYMHNELAQWRELKKGSWEKIPTESKQAIFDVLPRKVRVTS